MEEGIRQVLKIIFLLVVAATLITIIYFLRDIMYDKVSLVKDIFSNMFKFS